MWFICTTSKDFFKSILQGEQGPPGPPGPEEVVVLPPEFLPPKGFKVNKKPIFKLIVKQLNFFLL